MSAVINEYFARPTSCVEEYACCNVLLTYVQTIAHKLYSHYWTCKLTNLGLWNIWHVVFNIHINNGSRLCYQFD